MFKISKVRESLESIAPRHNVLGMITSLNRGRDVYPLNRLGAPACLARPPRQEFFREPGINRHAYKSSL